MSVTRERQRARESQREAERQRGRERQREAERQRGRMFCAK